MSTETIDRPRSAGPGSGLGGSWRVIVLNDSHNTFDHVAKTLARVIPGVNLDAGYRFADKIHNSGQAIVWTGQRGAGRALLGAAGAGGAHHGAARERLTPRRPGPAEASDGAVRISAEAG